MSLTKLKETSQITGLQSGGGLERNGICYFMCNFIESDLGPWNRLDSFETAITKAERFEYWTTMINFAKAQSSKKSPIKDLNQYQKVVGALEGNRIYRGALWVGKTLPAGESNHEIIMVTGTTDSDILYFEPNFGFFQSDFRPNRNGLERYIREQYHQLNPSLEVDNFVYYNVRNLSLSTPKGYISL